MTWDMFLSVLLFQTPPANVQACSRSLRGSLKRSRLVAGSWDMKWHAVKCGVPEIAVPHGTPSYHPFQSYFPVTIQRLVGVAMTMEPEIGSVPDSLRKTSIVSWRRQMTVGLIWVKNMKTGEVLHFFFRRDLRTKWFTLVYNCKGLILAQWHHLDYQWWVSFSPMVRFSVPQVLHVKGMNKSLFLGKGDQLQWLPSAVMISSKTAPRFWSPQTWRPLRLALEELDLSYNPQLGFADLCAGGIFTLILSQARWFRSRLIVCASDSWYLINNIIWDLKIQKVTTSKESALCAGLWGHLGWQENFTMNPTRVESDVVLTGISAAFSSQTWRVSAKKTLIHPKAN